MKRISGFVVGHPVASLVISVLVGLFFFLQIPSLTTIDNVDYFVVDDDPDFAYYQEIRSIFGEDEFFVIAFRQPDVFTVQNLHRLRDLTRKLESHSGTRNVKSLANVDYVDGAQEFFDVRPFLETIPDTREGLERLREQAMSTPLYLDNLISRDGQTLAIIVYPHEYPEDHEFRKRFLDDVATMLAEHEVEGVRFHLAGNTVSNVFLSRYVQQDLATFIPLTITLVALVILAVFRNLRLTILAMVNIMFCLGATMGFMALTGTAMHNVTSVVPSLVMALALADTVHIFSYLDRNILEAEPDKHAALKRVLDKVILPCFLTSLTTAVGFFSLSVSSLLPIREFAYVASMGMLLEFFFSFFLLPPLILFCNPSKLYRDRRTDHGLSGILHATSRFVRKQHVRICFVILFVAIGSGWFAGKIQMETNLLEYFKKESPLRQDLDFVQQHLSGVATMDISLRAASDFAFSEPENLLLLDAIQSFMHDLPGVDTSLSFADYIKDMNKSFHDEDPLYYVVPENRELIAQYLLLYDSRDIDDYINRSFDHARIVLRLSETSSARQAELIEATQIFLAGLETEGITIRITGNVVQQVNVIQALLDSLMASLALAVGVIALIMFLVLRSIKMGLLSFVPNIFPLLVNFGIMGLLGIPLDTSTALIAVVALGIAVDDTIHFLMEYDTQRKAGLPIAASLEQAVVNKGLAIVTTSVILSIGFGVLVFSNFVPTIYFGLLSAMVMITALIGDLILLPAIILLKKDRPAT
ncbi:efflux RND transporter permease subunit [Desulfonatronum parangueonense]